MVGFLEILCSDAFQGEINMFKSLLILLFSIQLSATESNDILGLYWSPKKDGRVEITKKDDGLFYGTLVWNKTPDKKDSENPDPELRDRTLRGMEFLKNFKFNDKKKWVDGSIYDPKSGKTYSCKIWLDDEKNMKVRGYIGISILGRTETFERYKLEDAEDMNTLKKDTVE